MKITLLAIAKLGRSPEAGLVRDYAERATASGRALGLGPVEIVELESRKPGKAAADNLDGLEGGHFQSRRRAMKRWLKSPVRRSVSCQPALAGQSAESSAPANPARMLTTAS